MSTEASGVERELLERFRKLSEQVQEPGINPLVQLGGNTPAPAVCFYVAEETKISADREKEHGVSAKGVLETEAEARLRTKFLEFVVAGNHVQVVNMLRSRPELARLPGNVTDLSQRLFVDVTGLQYAGWALDVEMCKNIRGFLQPEEVLRQRQASKTAVWYNAHGEHFNLQVLISAYQLLATQMEKAGQDLTEACSVLSKEQRNLPAHMMYDFCRGSFGVFREYYVEEKEAHERENIAWCYWCESTYGALYIRGEDRFEWKGPPDLVARGGWQAGEYRKNITANLDAWRTLSLEYTRRHAEAQDTTRYSKAGSTRPRVGSNSR